MNGRCLLKANASSGPLAVLSGYAGMFVRVSFCQPYRRIEPPQL